MRGILGKPSLCLDDHIDLKALSLIEAEIAHWVDSTYLDPKKGWHSVQYRRHNLYYKQGELVKGFYQDHPRYQEWRYRPVENTSIQDGCAFTIRSPANFGKKHIAELCVDRSFQKEFPILMEFARNLPMKHIGRIVIFVAKPGEPGIVHSDFFDSNQPCDAEFIWFRTNMDKRFFIIDDATEERHYLEGNTALFNTADYHGTEVAEKLAFSIRVDGYLSDWVKQQIGLDKLTSW